MHLLGSGHNLPWLGLEKPQLRVGAPVLVAVGQEWGWHQAGDLPGAPQGGRSCRFQGLRTRHLLFNWQAPVMGRSHEASRTESETQYKLVFFQASDDEEWIQLQLSVLGRPVWSKREGPYYIGRGVAHPAERDPER
jgi:hypothetical protein